MVTMHLSSRTVDVVVHLSTHAPVAAAVRAWCTTHGGRLATRHVAARADPRALRAAVPGLDLRSDHGREELRDYLLDDAETGPVRGVLWSTDTVLGPAYLHTGGGLHPFAWSGIAGLAAATRRHAPLAERRVALTLAPHAEVVTRSWIDALRRGHAVSPHEFVSALPDRPSWVPIVRRLVRDLGPDDVVVYPAAHGSGAGTAQRVLRDALRRLAPRHGLVVDAPATRAGVDPAWTTRQTDLVRAALPHLRSEAERTALREFVERDLVPLHDDAPATPLTPARNDDLAACDEADLATIRTFVEVR